HRYDAAGRLLATTWVARDSLTGDSVTYSYDIMGRMLSATTGNNGSVTRTWYANGLLKTETQTRGGTTLANSYGYDAAGRRTWYVAGTPGVNGDSISYVYDGTTGDLAWIKARWRQTPDGITHRDSVQLWWDALGHRDSVRYDNGAVIR